MEEKLAAPPGVHEAAPAEKEGDEHARGVVPPGALLPLGRALLDHHRGRATEPLVVRWDTGEEEPVSVDVFFRSEDELDALERRALDLCEGRVLDVGAGAGALSLPLIRRGHHVTALEHLADAATVLRERGVPTVLGDLWRVHPGGPYDTVLALMNGTGLAGTRARLPRLLARLAELGGEGCRILIDSTELTPPGAVGDGDPGDDRDDDDVQVQLAYGGHRGPPFPHLFVGPHELLEAARSVGLEARGVERWEGGRFLAVLERVAASRTPGTMPAETGAGA